MAEGKLFQYSSRKKESFNVQAAHEKNIIGEKIHEARKKSGMTQEEVAKNLAQYGIKLQKTSIHKWEKGDAVPTPYQLMALCYLFHLQEGLNYFFNKSLSPAPPKLNDKGLKLLADYERLLIESGRFRPTPEAHIIDMPMCSKDVYLIKASAGPGNYLDEESKETREFPAETVPENADFGVYVDGNSMEPVFINGQLIWIQKCEELYPGEVGLFGYDSQAFVKVYGEQNPSEEDEEEFTDSYGDVHMQPVLISYNPEYPPRPVYPNLGFVIFGRVLT